eukprot:TRINITY_DN6763_c0_g1_i1.p1 TRINITY_DN6763_c0_g1~~TRINITY_DN6763_c0_g1_i1.p1  ORF type:complete len:358 (+),score=127.09 TRINITY_DN6763_c0_g1_i1:122-1195(+)
MCIRDRYQRRVRGFGGAAMANRTDPAAATVHGANPQNLIEKILRQRIYGCVYWKEHCFGLTAETLVDKAINLEAYGGAHGALRKPTPFLCLVLKMLQIQPEKEIVLELIENLEYKYVRALGAFYFRLIYSAKEIYTTLEPCYNDLRRIRCRMADSQYVIKHMDEFIEQILSEDFVCDVQLPYLSRREALEANGVLQPRESAIQHEIPELKAQLEEQQRQLAAENPEVAAKEEKPAVPEEEPAKVSLRAGAKEEGKHAKGRYKDDRSRSRSPRRDSRRERDRSRSRDRRRGRSRSGERRRQRSPRRRSDSRERAGDKKKKKKKDKKDKQAVKKLTPEEEEIAEAQRLRAQLGIKPLRT